MYQVSVKKLCNANRKPIHLQPRRFPVTRKIGKINCLLFKCKQGENFQNFKRRGLFDQPV